MIVSINQPAYLPWLGYFDRIYKSDIHVVLDHVQFEKNSMINRNKILANGKEVMLTIPLQTKGKFGDLVIKDVAVIQNQKWRKKHLSSIMQSYSKAPCKADFFPELQILYEDEGASLGDVLSKDMAFFLRALGINNTQIVYSSGMNISGAKSELVLNICKALGATEYISGPFGREYLDEDSFADNGIEIIYHDYQHPEYSQMGAKFVPYLSTLDLLFNEGENALKILSHDKRRLSRV